VPHPNPGSPPYFDVNGDDQATAVDVLLVINAINGKLSAGGPEGEAPLTHCRGRPSGGIHDGRYGHCAASDRVPARFGKQLPRPVLRETVGMG